jgi:transcriptional antiterminator RfaH
MKQWYVVHTHTLGETKALFHLKRQGFDAYLPLYKKTRRHARKVDVVARPLFPRYLFVSLNIATDRWWSVQSTVGVSHLVCHGEHPTAVPGGMIDALRRREDADGYCAISELDAFKKGQVVEISDGPFSDFMGIFDAVSDTDRVYILLNLMGREVRVRVSVQAVKISA